MNAIIELEKRGYVFQIKGTGLVFTRTNVEQQNFSEKEVRAFFAEIALNKPQAVAYLLARGAKPAAVVDLEQDPSPALAAAMRHSAYIPGLPMWQQPPGVEEAWWSLVFSERDMQDPAYATER